MRRVIKEWVPVFLLLLSVLLVFISAEVWGGDTNIHRVEIPEQFERYTTKMKSDGTLPMMDGGVYLVVSVITGDTVQETVLFKLREENCKDCHKARRES